MKKTVINIALLTASLPAFSQTELIYTKGDDDNSSITLKSERLGNDLLVAKGKSTHFIKYNGADSLIIKLQDKRGFYREICINKECFSKNSHKNILYYRIPEKTEITISSPKQNKY
jgi:hypothetical protein